MDVKQERTAGIGHIGGMHLSVRQLPEKPAVHRSKKQIPPFRLRARALHMIQNPGNFCPGKIGIQQQPGFLPEHLPVPLAAQLLAKTRCSPILPYNGVVHRLPGMPIPYHRRLPLIRNPKPLHVPGRQIHLRQHLGRHANLRTPDLHRVVLHLARFRKKLGKLLLRCCQNPAGVVKKNRSRTRCPLIQR